jgi:hypothetical protein
MLTVVIGPPAAGKSTWVLERAKPGDIVVDFDRLAVALTGHGGSSHDHSRPVVAVARAARSAAIEAAIKLAKEADVYLIHSSPGPQLMARYHALGAEVVTVDPGRSVVRARCKSERPARMFAAIDEWYRARDQGDGRDRRPGRARSSPPVYAFPSSASRDW